MERKANYVLIGLFTFAVVLAAFGFVFWIHYAADKKQGVAYRVIFDGPVAGLRVGSSVLFNGIRVGEVTALKLNPEIPSQVNALILVNKATPIRSDTFVGLDFTGLTGIASISLRGNSATTPLLERDEGEPPTLKADISASQDMMKAAREVLAKADAVISSNQEDLHQAIQNFKTFTDALARNSESLDAIVANTKDATASAKDVAATAKDVATSAKDLIDNVDKRTAEMSTSFNVLVKTATKQVEVVGKSVTELAKNPQRILFGGGGAATR
jgi:phospholipid/cholesterol/gamma-HCH transport system substrate-binding protein